MRSISEIARSFVGVFKNERGPLGLSRKQWKNLSPQMQGSILSRNSMEADIPKRPLGLSAEQWNNLSPQMQGRLRSLKSMEEAVKNPNSLDVSK